ncbi:MAG: amidohydrolase [Candidatus Carbobacillus altaicus]|uniref:Peptidase M20 dimerisation domain-containing protein n=1 Tax=Candidatus Carbonibacillus altaicus TaxID=2163959 RepID=A0A2R6XZC0_9BACL|nr:amidohydrolase [Candidatus Carbobacillus altaicus]PTQ55765.1 MAG: hypothetical protein BSOLF_1498 [Candidatus Carbobacillus altaicus]
MQKISSIDLLQQVFQAIDDLFPEMVAWRRHLHQYPELSFEEVETPRFVADILKAWGVRVREGVGGRGVVGRIKGHGDGPTVALRADFDALPIEDEKEVSYRSKIQGKMHACGHDGHTATLLAVAKVLSDTRHLWPGEVVLIHQFAEELSPGGAQPMIDDGALDEVDIIFGTHLWSGLPLGMIGTRSGFAMANADRFTVEVQGRGGHGAAPHETLDAIVIAANIITKLQQIVARRIDPLKEAVVTIGKIQGGSAFNVIAERVTMEGTVRTFDEAVREKIQQELSRLVSGEAAMFGAEATLMYEKGYDALINDPQVTERFQTLMQTLYDAKRVASMPPTMGGEDFAYYLKRVPGTFFFTGAGNPAVQAAYPHHHPRFDIDERAMLIAGKALVSAALDALWQNAWPLEEAKGLIAPPETRLHEQH